MVEGRNVWELAMRRRRLGGMWGSPLDRTPAFEPSQASIRITRRRKGSVKVEAIREFADDCSRVLKGGGEARKLGTRNVQRGVESESGSVGKERRREGGRKGRWNLPWWPLRGGPGTGPN